MSDNNQPRDADGRFAADRTHEQAQREYGQWLAAIAGQRKPLPPPFDGFAPQWGVLPVSQQPGLTQ